jgi:hypothetical protein
MLDPLLFHSLSRHRQRISIAIDCHDGSRRADQLSQDLSNLPATAADLHNAYSLRDARIGKVSLCHRIVALHLSSVFTP